MSVNDVMFAVGATNGSPWGSGILRSPSPGDPWDWVELPDGPKPSTTEPTYWHVQPHDEQVVVSAARATLSEVSLWAWSSPDGTGWRGGPIGTFAGNSSAGRLHPIGDALVSVVQRDGGVVVVHSVDGAQSWEEAPVARLTVSEGESAGLTGEPWITQDGRARALVSFSGETSRGFANVLIEAPGPAGPWTIADPDCAHSEPTPRGHCNPSIEAGALTVRGVEVSLDGGRTWADAIFEEPLDRDPHRAISGFSSLGALPDGGWIGTIDGFIPAGGGPLAWVVRSDDGKAWSTLLGPGLDGCSTSPMDTDQPWAEAHEPAVLEGEVLTVFTCPGAGSGLYQLGTEPVNVRRTEPAQRLGKPFRHGGAVVAPIEDNGPRVRGFFVVQP
ncbi:MAG TPA: hypothetical protein VFV42_03205 [Acidimicrobiales bacterium]|nr:hypothetical protein [Acidimicrobiales bacterium]